MGSGSSVRLLPLTPTIPFPLILPQIFSSRPSRDDVIEPSQQVSPCVVGDFPSCSAERTDQGTRDRSRRLCARHVVRTSLLKVAAGGRGGGFPTTTGV